MEQGVVPVKVIACQSGWCGSGCSLRLCPGKQGIALQRVSREIIYRVEKFGSEGFTDRDGISRYVVTIDCSYAKGI